MNALGHRATEDSPKYVCVKYTAEVPWLHCKRSTSTSAGLKRNTIVDRITIQHFDVVNLHHVNDCWKAADRAGVKASCPRIKSQSCLAEQARVTPFCLPKRLKWRRNISKISCLNDVYPNWCVRLRDRNMQSVAADGSTVKSRDY